MKRKIISEVVIADSFHLKYEERWLVPDGESIRINIDVEFEWDEKEDSLKAVERVLDKIIKKEYPNKDYRIYYWDWIK